MTDAIQSAAGSLRAHLTHYTQDTRLLRLTTSLGADTLLVERIAGSEGLSEGYRFDIVAEIFSDYLNQGKLVPSWRLAVADSSQYQVRDVCTQFEESDLAFIERLLAEEGLFYWFEHTGDAGSESFGTHTVVIADHNGAFTPNKQNTIRYHRAAAVEQSDSVTAWHGHRQLVTNAITLGSWNETQVNLVNTAVDTAHNNGDAPALAAIDHPGQRRFATRAEIERTARRQLEALEARNKTYNGHCWDRLRNGSCSTAPGNCSPIKRGHLPIQRANRTTTHRNRATALLNGLPCKTSARLTRPSSNGN